ncbi:hypothetical protein [Agromyces sp. GXQ0307]|uniref:hypothetical protein n=1 Tax=Agromyces sp. GXQ0307 TaxID=3377835 RepID=UPI00383A67FD
MNPLSTRWAPFASVVVCAVRTSTYAAVDEELVVELADEVDDDPDEDDADDEDPLDPDSEPEAPLVAFPPVAFDSRESVR